MANLTVRKDIHMMVADATKCHPLFCSQKRHTEKQMQHTKKQMQPNVIPSDMVMQENIIYSFVSS